MPSDLTEDLVVIAIAEARAAASCGADQFVNGEGILRAGISQGLGFFVETGMIVRSNHDAEGPKGLARTPHLCEGSHDIPGVGTVSRFVEGGFIFVCEIDNSGIDPVAEERSSLWILQ